jgi:asparagine synthase (glutamine-hydrolysing)
MHEQLRPGCYMTCSSFDYMEQRQYWELGFPDRNVRDPRTEAEIVAGVRQRIKEAVRIRLRADVPVGIYLSGGIDSAAICGITASLIEEECARTGQDVQEAKNRIKCFCIGFDAKTTFDETGDSLLH